MVASFIIFVIILILRLIMGSLTGKFAFLIEYIPYANYACIGGAALFAVFVVAKLLATLFSGRGNRR